MLRTGARAGPGLSCAPFRVPERKAHQPVADRAGRFDPVGGAQAGANRLVACIHPAGQRAEGRQDHARRRALAPRDDCAGTSNTAPTNGHLQLGMPVAGKFASGLAPLCFVTAHDAANLKLFMQRATALRGSSGSVAGVGTVVVAGDPDPLDLRGERAQHIACDLLQPRRTFGIVKIVAQRHDPLRTGLAHCQSHPFQRLAAVVGGQVLAVAREKARLFEVQVGDEQCALARLIDRTIAPQEQLRIAERKGNHGPHLP